MDTLEEITAEDHLMDIFSMKEIEERIDKTGLGKVQFKQKLVEGLRNGNIRQGKTAEQTLKNYDNYLIWEGRKEWIEEQLLNRPIWGAIGIALTAPVNYVISSPIINRMNKDGLFSKEGFLQFAAFSLGAFIIEKRILTGLGNYWERTPSNEKPNMKVSDYFKLLSGYIISEFPHIRNKGKEIINSYRKESEPERWLGAANQSDSYSTLLAEKEVVHSVK